MPWPMRFGPPPRIIDLVGRRARVGAASHGVLVGRIHVGGRGGELRRAGVDRLYTGCTPSAWRARAPRPRCVSVSTASRASEKPIALQRAHARRVGGQAVCRILLPPRADDAAICARNQGSILQEVKISSSTPAGRKASATMQERSASARRARGADRVLVVVAAEGPRSRLLVEPVSRSPGPRSAFCRTPWKVRPIAITSPTDFIEVVSVFGRREISRRRSAESW
jgi:hypothetical protein